MERIADRSTVPISPNWKLDPGSALDLPMLRAVGNAVGATDAPLLGGRQGRRVAGDAFRPPRPEPRAWPEPSARRS